MTISKSSGSHFTLQPNQTTRGWMKVGQTWTKMCEGITKGVILMHPTPTHQQHNASDPPPNRLLTRRNTLVVTFHSIFISAFSLVAVALGTEEDCGTVAWE